MSTAQSLGAALGTGVSTGVSTGLQGLMQQYHKTKEQQKVGGALAEFLEKPELAGVLGNMPLDMQKDLLKSSMEQKKQIQLQQLKAPEQPKLSQPTVQWIKDIDKAGPSAESVVETGRHLMTLADKMGGVRGAFGKVAPGLLKPADVADFNSTVLDLISSYKAMFPRGITGQEFKILQKEALPSSSLSPKANKAIIQRFINRAEKMVERQQKMISVQEKYGYVPENIKALVTGKGETPDLTETKAEGKGFEIGQGFSSLPSTAPEGAVMRKGNERFIFRKGKWSKL